MFTVYLILLKQKFQSVQTFNPLFRMLAISGLPTMEDWRQNMQNNAITGLWTLGTLYRDKHISPTAKTAAGSEGAQSSPSHSVFPPLEMLTGSQ